MILLRFLIVLLPLYSLAQSNNVNQSTSNGKVKKKYTNTPDSLARSLTSGYTTDIDKVRSIFTWIAGNIEYNSRPWRNAPRVSPDAYLDDPNDTGALKPLNERVAIDVLDRRIAFCDGYARLFKTLCDYAGLKSEIITGYANGGIRRPKFSSNHRWNAVYLDSSWHLLDVTWSSGYVTYSSDFVQHFNDKYFLTPAHVFINDHYPEDLKWSLLPKPPSLVEYRISPFTTNAYVKNRIRSYKPESGVLQASLGDTLHFEIETESEEKRLLVVDTPYVDSAFIAEASLVDSAATKFTITGRKLNFSYIVSSPNTEWLQIILNEEVVMRYKVNIRKDAIAAN